MQEKTINNIISRLEKEIFHYRVEDEDDRQWLVELLQDESHGKGHAIVDYFELPRRHYRQAIYRIIEEECKKSANR